MNIEQFEAFVGKSKEYYLDYLDSYANGKKAMFSIYAFLFGIFWFLYRKMYIQALVVFVLLMVLSIVQASILVVLCRLPADAVRGIDLLTDIAFAIAVGFYANRAYIEFANIRIRAIVKRYPNDEQKQMDKIRRRGGTSVWGIVIVAAFVVLLIACLQSR